LLQQVSLHRNKRGALVADRALLVGCGPKFIVSWHRHATVALQEHFMTEIRNYTMNFGFGRRFADRRIDLTCLGKLAFTATSASACCEPHLVGSLRPEIHCDSAPTRELGRLRTA